MNDWVSKEVGTGGKLVLHCGANLCEFNELDQYVVPDTTRGVHLPHAEMVNMTIGALREEGYSITEHAHSITKEGARYFGMLAVSKQNMLSDEFATVVGMRNAYDGSSSAGFVMGMQLFVCDNLAFHGDVQFSLRHDRNMFNFDLMVASAARKLEYVHSDMVKRTTVYKEAELSLKEADHLMVEMLRRGVYNPSRIELVRAEWDTPSHAEFNDQNLWRMHNAVTEALKPRNPAEQGALPRIANQTNRLHRLFDEHTGLQLAA